MTDRKFKPRAGKRTPGCVWVCAFSLLTALLLLSSPSAAVVQNQSAAKDPSASELLQDGILALQRSDFVHADFLFEKALSTVGPNEGSMRCDILLALAEVRQMTGQYRDAIEILSEASTLVQKLDDPEKKARIEGAVGNAHLGLGNESAASKHMLEGLALARENGSGAVAAAIMNNLGNLSASQEDFVEAGRWYRESVLVAEQSGDSGAAASATVNLAMIALRKQAPLESKQELGLAVQRLKGLEDSRTKAFGLINAGLTYSELGNRYPEMKPETVKSAYMAFSEAVSTARQTGDSRTLSYGLGHLGALYEAQGRLQEGLDLTRRAVIAAQQQNVNESLYRWYRQAGRILDRLGDLDEAILSYRHALHNLQAIREEMGSCYASPESSYQKAASVISAEMVDLLLRRSSQLKEGESVEPWLEEARDTLEAHKIYELREYFRDDCIDAARYEEKRLDTISTKTAVIYPIILADRTELMVSVSGKLERFTVPIGEGALTEEIRELRRTLVKRTTWEFLPHAQTLYTWLIKPLETSLRASDPDTLVFVPGGALRTIPMAALHDGEQFLINRYRIAVTPSINLTDPRPLHRAGARVLSLGITVPVHGFPGLPYVDKELEGIRRLFDGSVLLNEEFQTGVLQESLKTEPYNVVHIASHGHFGGDVHDSYILAYDERFTMERIGEYVGLFRFRDEPLDMLTLSACETAIGNDRAALGLAGVAVRAGARSALATLWHVNDPASQELILEFYRNLRNPAVSRAQALQAAQLKLVEDPRYDHPGYWAPFILINDWQ